MCAAAHAPKWQREFLKHLESSRFVSLDVFDTCLARKVWDPLDVFAVVEARMVRKHGDRAAGFAEERRISEYTRRMRNWESAIHDITFDEIYGELRARNPHWHDLTHAFQAAEMRVEQQALVARPEVLKLALQAHRKGCEIHYLSDMYLPSKYISDMLRNRGFPTPENTRVSGELRQTKHDGGLYDLVLAEHAILPGAWLHMGDNPRADYQVARSRGIRAVLLPKTADILRKHPHFSRILARGHKPSDKGDGRSVLFGTLAARTACGAHSGNGATNDFWENLGYIYAGPLFLGFAAWIARQSRALGIERIFFISGKGNIVQRVYAHITAGQAGYADSTCLQVSPRADTPTTPKQNDKQAGHERIAYMRYLSDSGFAHTARMGLVDIGWHSTIQRTLLDLIPTPPECYRGFYLGTLAQTLPDTALESFIYHRGCPGERTATIHHGIKLIEFLFLAAEKSFPGMDAVADGTLRSMLDPRTRSAETDPMARAIHTGAEAFVRDFSELADPITEAPDGDFVYELMHHLVCKPTLCQVKLIGDIRLRDGFGTHAVSIPLAAQLKAVDVLLRPLTAARKVSQSLWPPATLKRLSPLQRLWLQPWLKALKDR